ncbi:MAG: hypothetical protein QOE93_1771 [Actinomycetota bacterium]|nr:hypothetical protein [Actinomycetota bacterium]
MSPTSRPLAGTALVLALALALVLALALAGCSDSPPAAEVRVGGSSAAASGSITLPDSGGGRPTGSTSSTPAGTDDGGTESSPPSEPTEPGPVDPSPPGSTAATQPPADDALPPVTSVAGDPRRPHGWDGYTVASDGRTLTFTYYAGVAPCSVYDSVVAEETASTVRVTIYERSGPDGTVCIMIAQQKTATVTLEAPLGGRAVVDGAK